MFKKLDIRKFVVEACFFGLLWQLAAGLSMYLWNPGIFISIFPDLYYSKLIAQELLFVALFGIFIYLIIRILFSFVFYFSPKISAAFSMLGYTLFVTIYVFSWMQFLTFGKFITLSSIVMFIASPVQMLMHANDVADISIYRIAFVPISLLIIFYVLKQYLLDKLPHKVLFSAFLSLNVACAFINTLRIDETPYTKRYVQFHRTMLSHKDYMRYLQVNAASPLITIKETAINQLLSNYASQQNEGVEFVDILSLAQSESILRGTDIKDWDVIIMEIESLHPQVLSAINSNLKEKVMPTVDAIAANSHIFTNAYAQASHSSYADLVPLSSLYPLRSKNVYIYPEKTIYPKAMIYDVLSKFGYKTAVISSQNEEWQGMDNYLKSPGLGVFIHAGNYKEMLGKYKWKIENIHTYGDKEVGRDPLISFAGKLADHTTVSIINSWISTLGKDEHYFLYTNLQNSHFPFFTPSSRTPHFFKSKDEEEEVRINMKNKHYDKENSFKRHDVKMFRTLYNEALNGIDDEVKRLVVHLKNLGRWKNTLLVITADTSTRFSGAKLGNGADLFEEVLHVPLIIKVPEKHTKVDARLMQHLDVTPTVLGYMGFNKHPVFQGKDFSDTKNCNQYTFAVAHTAVAYQYSVVSDDGLKLTIDAHTKQVGLELLNGGNDKLKDIARREELLNVLKTWIGGQIGYYDNDVLMSSKYPPQFSFNNLPCN